LIEPNFNFKFFLPVNPALQEQKIETPPITKHSPPFLHISELTGQLIIDEAGVVVDINDISQNFPF
jgi:hypothetical protein